MKTILPGLTVEGASLLTQLALRGLQVINAEAQAAGAALEAAIAAAPQALTEAPISNETNANE